MAINIKPSHRGLLHEKLGISKTKDIPNSILASKKKNANPALKKEIVFAQNAKKWSH